MNYYYLISSLPELAFGMEKPPIRRPVFEERLKNNLSRDDYALYAATTGDFFAGKEHVRAGSRFLAAYAVFEKDLRNFMVGVNMKKTGKNYSAYIAGTDDIVSEAVRHSSLSDFGLGKELAYAGQIIELMEQKKYLELEQFIDRVRFERIDEMNRFHYFDLDYMLGYSFQLAILERWERLNEQGGTKRLHELAEKDIRRTELYQVVA